MEMQGRPFKIWGTQKTNPKSHACTELKSRPTKILDTFNMYNNGMRKFNYEYRIGMNNFCANHSHDHPRFPANNGQFRGTLQRLFKPHSPLKFYPSWMVNHEEDRSPTEAFGLMGFLNWTNIIVILSHPSPPAVGATHLSNTLSQMTESLLSCIVKQNCVIQCVRMYVYVFK